MQNVLNSFAIPVSTPGELAGIATNRFSNGQPAMVNAMRPGSGAGLYYLSPAISILPDNFFVVPTFDDPLRQWVYIGIQEQGTLSIVSAEIDLTVSPQTIFVLPPLTGYHNEIGLALGWFPTQKDGTVTTGPTAQAGTDAAIVNLVASTIQAGLAAGGLNTRQIFSGAVAASTNLDLSANGIIVKITNPATLGTATVFKARIGMFSSLAKF